MVEARGDLFEDPKEVLARAKPLKMFAKVLLGAGHDEPWTIVFQVHGHDWHYVRVPEFGLKSYFPFEPSSISLARPGLEHLACTYPSIRLAFDFIDGAEPASSDQRAELIGRAHLDR
jgi:hypothetical protein